MKSKFMKNKFLKYIYPFLSAIILIGAFPRFDIIYLAWIALVPLIIYLLKVNPRQAFAGGMIFGITFHSYINFYLITALNQFVSDSFAILLYSAIVMYLGFFYALFFYFFNRFFLNFSAIKKIFFFSYLWIIIECLRSLGFLGYTAGFIAYSQSKATMLMNPFSFYGYWGPAFIMVALQFIIALVITKKISLTYLRKALVVWIILLFSGLLIPELFSVYEENEKKTIALIQANISREDILKASMENLDTYIELTEEAIGKNDDIDLVVWAETVISARIGRGSAAIPEVRALSDSINVPLLYGAIVIEDDTRFNTVAYLSPSSAEAEVYYKKLLVPFVEFFPFAETLNNLLDLRVRLGSLSRGEEITVFDFRGVPVSGAVCFESFFGSYTRKFATEGAHHLFILTNDGWLRETNGIDQHANMVAIRGAEMGIGVTQVANSGITVSADYRGKELIKSGIKSREILFLETNFPRRKTLYRIAGDYFIYVSSVIFLLILVTNKRKKVVSS